MTEPQEKPPTFTLLDLELFVASLKARMVQHDGTIANTAMVIDADEHSQLEALHRLMLLMVNRKNGILKVLRGRAE